MGQGACESKVEDGKACAWDGSSCALAVQCSQGTERSCSKVFLASGETCSFVDGQCTFLTAEGFPSRCAPITDQGTCENTLEDLRIHLSIGIHPKLSGQLLEILFGLSIVEAVAKKN